MRWRGVDYKMEFNPFRWKGYYFDVVTGFYYLQSRYYDPVIGRFINADDPRMLFSEAMMPMGANLFMYCYNNPVMFRDDSGYGFLSVLLVGIIIGALVGGASAGIAAYNADLRPSDGNFWLAVGSGVLVGGVLGAAAPLGAAAFLGKVSGTAILIMAGVTFGAGMLGYAMDTVAFDREFDTRDMFWAGGNALARGGIAFFLGMITAGAGLWGNNNMEDIGTINTIARLMFMQPLLMTGNAIIDLLFIGVRRGIIG